MAEQLTLHSKASHQVPASLISNILANRELLFWSLQLGGWFGISLISYVSLNLWYNQPEWSYVLHNILQSILGIALSWPLRWVFRRYWGASWVSRSVIVGMTVAFFALAWSIIRLALFQAMTQETNLWPDFGGWYFSSIFIFLCWAAFYHGIKYYELLQAERDQLLVAESTRQEEMLRRISAEAAVKEGQLTLLRYQLNPHFLFNTLNSIYALVDQGAGTRAQTMLLNLSNFLRYSLEHGTSRSVPLGDEISATKMYLEIEQVRFADRLSVEFDIADEASQANVPSFLLQPLIENAIKHAIALSEEAGKILISARCEDQILCIAVEDTGASESQAARRQAWGAGVGLSNVRERIAATYGEDGSLRTGKSGLGGFRVDVNFPLNPSTAT